MSQHSLCARGFHLIEILITLVIIGFLATISIPTYTAYLTREKRIEAEGMLNKLAIALEQYQLTDGSYQGATLALLKFPEHIVKNNYRLIIQSTTDNDYVLSAKPQGEQAKRDAQCGILSMNAVGEKYMSGSGSLTECW